MKLRKVEYALSYEYESTQHMHRSAKVCFPSGLEFFVKVGRRDSWDIWQIGTGIHKGYVVYSENRGLGYCGVTVYDACGSEVWNMFLQGSDLVKDVLGPRGLDLRDYTKAKRILRYWQ